MACCGSVFGHLITGIAVSNTTEGMNVHVVCCVGSGLFDELITCPAESHCTLCMCVCARVRVCVHTRVYLRARVRTCVCVCGVCVCERERDLETSTTKQPKIKLSCYATENKKYIFIKVLW